MEKKTPPDYQIRRALEKLGSEMNKDQAQTETIKERQIQEVLSFSKEEMFAVPKKKKMSFLTRLSITLGYGKKG